MPVTFGGVAQLVHSTTAIVHAKQTSQVIVDRNCQDGPPPTAQELRLGSVLQGICCARHELDGDAIPTID